MTNTSDDFEARSRTLRAQIGRRIRIERRRQRITLKDLEAVLEVPVLRLGEWERGLWPMHVEELILVCRAIRRHPADVLGAANLGSFSDG